MATKKNLNRRNIELLFEVGAFRRIDRTWKHFLSPGVANNAEHSFRVAWIALTLAAYEKKEVDLSKMLKLALLHDLPESRCGDVNYLSRQYVKRQETEAVSDIFEGTVHQKEMTELFLEYEKRQTLEAKLVKDADNLDIELELKELAAQGNSLDQLWRSRRRKNVYPKLFTETARLFWQEITRVDPHSWHSDSLRNRHHLKDWDKK